MHGCLTAFHWYPHYGRIFVYIFCLINIFFSFSDEAVRIMSLNIERLYHFHLSLKIGARYIKQFGESLWTTQNVLNYKECNATISQFPNVAIFFVVSWKDQKLARIGQVNQLFLLLNLIFSTAKSSVSKNVNRYLRRRQTCLESLMDQSKILEICPSTLR